MRSDTVKKGFERAPHRSLLKATGVTDADMGKPFIAVCNSFVEIVPGHVHLNRVGRYVKECIREAGGVAFEFNTIGVDDGIAMGHRRDALLPAVARDHRRLRRDDAQGPLLRRDDLHPQLRQDRPRHADGARCGATSRRSSSPAAR